MKHTTPDAGPLYIAKIIFRLCACNPAGAEQKKKLMSRELLAFLAGQPSTHLTGLATCLIPEVVDHTEMLFVPCAINGHPTQAMIDTGADVSIIEQDLVEPAGLATQLDTQWTGSVDGVGSVDMLGRLSAVVVQVGPTNYLHSFVVMKHRELKVVLGLDFLAHHECTIDLINRQLVLGNGADVIPFVSK